MLLMMLNVQSKLYPQNFYLYQFFPNMPSVMNIRFHFVTRCHELENSSRTLTLVTKWYSMSRCSNSSRTYCHEVLSSRSYIPSGYPLTHRWMDPCQGFPGLHCHRSRLGWSNKIWYCEYLFIYNVNACNCRFLINSDTDLGNCEGYLFTNKLFGFLSQVFKVRCSNFQFFIDCFMISPHHSHSMVLLCHLRSV